MAIYKINDRVFNTLSRTITLGTDDVRKLSQSEVYLLAYLIENQGKVIDKTELMGIGWPKKVVVVNSLTVAISNLRKALEDPDIISSNKGIGYTFSLEAIVDHNSEEDENEDENYIKDYNMSSVVEPQQSSVLNLFFYVSIIMFLTTSTFIINWILSYVSGNPIL